MDNIDQFMANIEKSNKILEDTLEKTNTQMLNIEKNFQRDKDAANKRQFLKKTSESMLKSVKTAVDCINGSPVRQTEQPTFTKYVSTYK